MHLILLKNIKHHNFSQILLLEFSISKSFPLKTLIFLAGQQNLQTIATASKRKGTNPDSQISHTQQSVAYMFLYAKHFYRWDDVSVSSAGVKSSKKSGWR